MENKGKNVFDIFGPSLHVQICGFHYYIGPEKENAFERRSAACLICAINPTTVVLILFPLVFSEKRKNRKFCYIGMVTEI